MATRNQTALFRKYREALRSVRPYASAGSSSLSGQGGAIELVEAPLLNQGGPRGYNAIGAEDPDASNHRCGSVFSLLLLLLVLLALPSCVPNSSSQVEVLMHLGSACRERRVHNLECEEGIHIARF